MAVKFGLNYFLSVTSNVDVSQAITVQPPFTLEFDVTRSVNGSLNNATFRIMNLGKQTRNKMLKDYFDFTIDRTVYLQAGYGNTANLPTIYYGTVFSAYSQRQGGTEFVTEISAQSGGFAVPKVYYTGPPFAQNVTDRTVINTLVVFLAQQTGLNVGYIGQFPNVSASARFSALPVYDWLQELSGNGVFIDNNQINVIKNGEAIPKGTPIKIDSSMGLLETPRREQSNMVIPIIFTPEILPGSLINLQAATLEDVNSNSPVFQNYNGLQKVNSVRHYGTISGAVTAETKTEIGITYGIPAVAA